MAISPYKSFLPGEVLTAADLNSSFTQITSNALALISPLTGDLDVNGNTIVLDADGDLKVAAVADDILGILVGTAQLFKFDGSTASAVNGLQLQAAATGNPPRLTAQGSDTNINLVLEPKGASNLVVQKAGGSALFNFKMDGASPVNGLDIKSAATGLDPTIEATGSDTHVDIALVPKGANGRIRVGVLLEDDCIRAQHINDDEINSQHYAAGSIDLEHLASEVTDSFGNESGVSNLTFELGSANNIASTSYADFCSITYTPRSATSRCAVSGTFDILNYTGPAPIVTLRRGTTVISVERTYTNPAAGTPAQFELRAVDTGHGGSSTTWNISAKRASAGGTNPSILLMDIWVMDFPA